MGHGEELPMPCLANAPSRRAAIPLHQLLGKEFPTDFHKLSQIVGAGEQEQVLLSLMMMLLLERNRG
jgi:hypothetical protein